MIQPQVHLAGHEWRALGDQRRGGKRQDTSSRGTRPAFGIRRGSRAGVEGGFQCRFNLPDGNIVKVEAVRPRLPASG